LNRGLIGLDREETEEMELKVFMENPDHDLKISARQNP